MKNLDKIFENAKKQNIEGFPFADDDIRNFAAFKEVPKTNNFFKQLTGTKIMGIAAAIISLITGIFMLTTNQTPDIQKESPKQQKQITGVATNSNNDNKTASDSITIPVRSRIIDISTGASRAGDWHLIRQPRTRDYELDFSTDGSVRVDVNKIGDNEAKPEESSQKKIIKKVSVFLGEKDKAKESIDFVILNENEMNAINIFKTNCGFSMLCLEDYDLFYEHIKNKDEILAAGYPASGQMPAFTNCINGFISKGDMIKYDKWDMSKSLGIFPEYCGYFTEGNQLDPSWQFSSASGLETDKYRSNLFFMNTGSKLNTEFANIMRDYPDASFRNPQRIKVFYDPNHEEYKVIKYYIPVLVKIKGNNMYEYLVLLYPATSHFRAMLPSRYHNIKVYDEIYTNMDKEYGLEKFNQKVATTYSSATNLCRKPNTSSFDYSNKQKVEPLAGFKYLSLDKETLEKLGIYVENEKVVCIYDRKNNIDKRKINEQRMKNFAEHNYDTTQATISIINKHNMSAYSTILQPYNEIIDRTIDIIKNKPENFYSHLFFHYDSLELRKELPNYTERIDKEKMQRIIPELAEYISEKKYDIPYNSYILSLMESLTFKMDTNCQSVELLNKEELDKHKLAPELGLLFSMRREINMRSLSILDSYANAFFTGSERIKERYDNIQFHFSTDSSGYAFYSNRKNVIPIEYSYYWKSTSGDSMKTTYIFWYYVDYNFTAKLPEKYRKPLEKELEIMGKVTRGEMRSDEICEALQGETSFFGLCDEATSLFQDLKMFPNPTNSSNSVSIVFNLSEKATVTVFLASSTGNVIKTIANNVSLEIGQQSLEANVAGLTKGLYQVQIITNDGRKISRKLIVN